MRRVCGSACLLLLLARLSFRGLAQDGVQPATKPMFKVDSPFVWVPVSFENPDGNAIRDAEISGIQLWDNGLRQKLLPVRTDDLPVSLVILMQTGGSARRFLSSYADLPSLIGNLVGDSVHEITLITFDSRIEEVWHFPNRSDGVNYALTHQEAGDQGAAIKDAVAFGVRQLQAEPGRFRRIVLLLSENTDRGSSTASQSLLEQLGSASTIVYSLRFPNRTEDANRFRDHARSSKSTPASELSKWLGALDRSTAEGAASLTGGCSFQFNDQRSFNSGLLAIAEHFRDAFTFGFQPVPDAPGFHALKVEVLSPRFRITARKAYWSTLAK